MFQSQVNSTSCELALTGSSGQDLPNLCVVMSLYTLVCFISYLSLYNDAEQEVQT